jgi:hypothetical protein
VDPTPPDPGATSKDLDRQREELHAKPGVTVWIEVQRGGHKKALGFKIAENEAADPKIVEARIRDIFRQAVEPALAAARELEATVERLRDATSHKASDAPK